MSPNRNQQGAVEFIGGLVVELNVGLEGLQESLVL